jgi:hypothetical protein
VGVLTKTWHHPESEKLWCEEIDLGEAAVRQVCSGLRAFYTEEQFKPGRKVRDTSLLTPMLLATPLSPSLPPSLSLSLSLSRDSYSLSLRNISLSLVTRDGTAELGRWQMADGLLSREGMLLAHAVGAVGTSFCGS